MTLRPCHALLVLAATCLSFAAQGQTPAPALTPSVAPETHYLPAPMFDLPSMDPKTDPCTDFYKFACGNYAANNPIPADQTSVNQFQTLYNVDNQELNGILKQYAAPAANRTTNQQKIGDYYAACMNTGLIDQKGLTPIQPLLDAIDRVSKSGLPYLTGELQRYGVGVFFGFGEQQDFKDSTRQIAIVSQGGLGLPERDYYTRTGDKDKLIREQYVALITKVLNLSGETAQQSALDAKNILAFETKLAEASLTNVEMRNPDAIYHPQSLAAFEADIKPVPFAPFLEAIHAPAIDSLNNATPRFFPALVEAVVGTDIHTLRAYMRFHLLDAKASVLPTPYDEADFNFFGRQLEGQPQQLPRWKRCSAGVDSALGEALGQVYVEQYFAGDSKARTLVMVQDIEAAMDHDIDTLQWMGPATKLRAKEKLHAVVNKIGYANRWRDYSTLAVSATDAVGNAERASAFENDRQLAKIGKPVDKFEWDMTPPTVNADYDPSMNTINFPAGILQPAFYDPKADLAVNYGHMGAVVGHELTHGFDDEGKKFDAKGNLSDWWTTDDTKNFEAKTGCLVNEYSSFIAVPDPREPARVNGKLTLGENTADNGGLVLAYLAYLDRAQKQGLDTAAKLDGYTGPQRFYIAFAQNWCENARPEQTRNQVLTDPHSPNHFRANGAIVNQPAFASAFGCKVGAPMVPVNSCRVW